MRKPQPTPVQKWMGHGVVGLSVSYGVHRTAKPHPLVSLGIGAFAVVIHDYFDAPVSQAIATLAA
ncbi:MAG: hypothetical protein HKL85_12585 [Acidimicrobiaceae bacterium]|nr:hypothetical protein [Acidimicrobiaceae bacterium]